MDTATPLPKATPMVAQYLEIKKSVGDAILFYRMGDFYEMFFEDAVKAAPILGVQLTSRDKNAENPMAMCGVPHHAISTYIQRVINAGMKVALCDQIGDPSTQKGLLKREVTRIVTPGLVANPDLVGETKTRFLLGIKKLANGYSVGRLDLLGGTLAIGEVSNDESLIDTLGRVAPKEVLVGVLEDLSEVISTYLLSLAGIAITERPNFFDENVDMAIARYVDETQGIGTASFLRLTSDLVPTDSMRLDVVTLRSLEILEGQNSEIRGVSLLESVDRCETALGRRCLKEWLSRPLCNVSEVVRRQDVVSYFSQNVSVAAEVGRILCGIRDLERLATKVSLGLALSNDLVAIRSIQQRLPALRQLLVSSGIEKLMSLGTSLDPLLDLTQELTEALLDEPSPGTRDGDIFRDEYRLDIRELRAITRDVKSVLFELEGRERTGTGISSLKVKYNRVFGYSIEVTKTHLDRIPPHFIRKQTLANAERFVTEELAGLEEKILSADERLKRLEEGLFLELRGRVSESASVLRNNAKLLAEIDVLLSFSQIARERGYVRPVVHAGWDLIIEEGRHPVAETLISRGQFVPNSIEFRSDGTRTLLITGPNMAGKSTIMRQVALISILGQCGSFVPCRAAHLGVVDGIYTRIGASDDLATGKSTFMVEMAEVARILEQGTTNSLILIDEIGRGTSTYDGLSLAWSLLEYFHEALRSKLLFATHFHELTSLESRLSGLTNVNVLVRKVGEEIVFLHRLEQGACSQSYGVDVARLARLPPKVLLRAKDILGVLETQSARGLRVRSRALGSPDKQLGFFEA